ncbi:thioesterase-like superfamily-domain-containing protein [Mucidula mucida]|nr:thioesterase-like superfamily-domain-containing protein [Mucidula mucida]
MAPLYKAIHVERTTASAALYRGVIDPEWSIAAVPNGGYVISLIIEACMQFQAGTPTPDPIHVTAHFLQSATAGSPAFEIHIRVLKTGRLFTNFLAEFVQKGRTPITAHLMFGKLAPFAEKPSSYTRRLPLYRHPSTAPLRVNDLFYGALTYAPNIDCTLEPEIAARNEPDSPNRTCDDTHGGGGMEWGSWFTLKDLNERLTLPSLAIFADTLLNPPGHDLGALDSWFPTMVMTLEFKFPIPLPSKDHADRTVGAFSTGSTILAHPHKRHNTHVEIWSAPSNVGEGEEREGWRSKQVCLAVASQMAMIRPLR